MAAKKKARGELDFSNAAALQHADVAFGRRYLKPGFGFNEAQDVAWALGWPHFTVIDDVTKPKLPEWQGKLFMLPDFALSVPRAEATFAVRLLSLPRVRRDYKEWVEKVRPQLERTDPVSADEALEILEINLNPDCGFYLQQHFRRTLFAMEGLVGPSAMAEGVTRAFERLSLEQLTTRNVEFARFFSTLGFFLLRVPETEHASLTERLEAVFQRVASTFSGDVPPLDQVENHSQLWRVLDVILHGKLGAKRSGDGAARGKVTRASSLFCHDQEFVVACAKQWEGDPQGSPPFSRLVFLGERRSSSASGSGWSDTSTQTARRSARSSWRTTRTFACPASCPSCCDSWIQRQRSPRSPGSQRTPTSRSLCWKTSTPTSARCWRTSPRLVDVAQSPRFWSISRCPRSMRS